MKQRPGSVQLVSIKSRFARSANVERDDLSSALEGYVPTARAVDVVTRVVAGLAGGGTERAISVTGPYGSGKSSLALFLGALFGPDGAVRDSATDLLAACDNDLADRLVESRKGASESGFIIAAVVAQREPVTATLLRALRVGILRFAGGEESARRVSAMREVLEASATPAADQVRRLINGLAAVAPVLIVLDEFGKNLEQFVATGGAEDDLFVLQDIAEWAASSASHPIVLLTLQHLAFEDYAAGASASKRREWSKVQGRFADVPYVESAAQSQALIASVYERHVDLEKWSREFKQVVDRAGIADQLHREIAQLYPLHPVAAAVLPELCSRYGQNERTLFSFLAGPDPGAVPAILRAVEWQPGFPLPVVNLDQVYDFFLESASTMVSASASATRWLEIETRIRDAIGVSSDELRLLKSVAVLNLVTAGGALRASRAMLDAIIGTAKKAKELDQLLSSLEARGLLTYRAFADEYRIWNGSDFDLKGAVELARRRLADEPADALLARVRPQAPVVAARHSQKTGTLRVFERRFVAAGSLPALDASQKYDGAILLDVSGDFAPDPTAGLERPVVIGRARHTEEVVAAGRELAAHLDVLAGPEGRDADWVARRELVERAASVASTLDHALERAFGAAAVGVRWDVIGAGVVRSKHVTNLSAVLSSLCDARYPDAPIVRNEMLSRRELTSQGARARRELLEAMVLYPLSEHCGIVGYGPERAMYEAVLARPKIHRRGVGDHFGFGAPVDEPESDDDLNFGPAWSAIEELFSQADAEVVPLERIYQRLMAPPIGLKEGPIPVLLVAALLAHAQDVALYENGSFVARLDPPAVERLIRNPDLFSFKTYATHGPRAAVVQRLAELLSVARTAAAVTRVSSIVNVVGPLLGRARALPQYSQKTRRLSDQTRAVRSSLFAATEPDQLLFRDLPVAVGLEPFDARASLSRRSIDTYVEQLAESLAELNGAYGRLLDHIEEELQKRLVVRGDDVRSTISARVSQFSDLILDPDVKGFVYALSDRVLDREEWLSYLGMVVVSKATESWTDEDVSRYDLRINELCAAVRRIEGLYYGQTAPAEGFKAVRVSLTTADGTDRPRVVWVDESAQEHLLEVVRESFARVDELVGPAGREMLLATLAMELLGVAEAIPETSAPSTEQVRKVLR